MADSKEVYNLKELEKLGAQNGIVFNMVKDVLQSLVDDNIVESDKIGSGNYFWCLPSRVMQSIEENISQAEKNTIDLEKDVRLVKEQIKAETVKREPTEERRKMLSEVDDLSRQIKKIEAELVK